MKKENLDNLSKEDLIKKERSTKALIIVFIPLILALSFFVIRDYNNGLGIDMPLLIITICSVGGAISLLPTLKLIRKKRDEKK